MTRREWLFNLAPNGTALTTANVKATDGTAATIIAPGTGNTITASTAHPQSGTLGMRITTAATATAAARLPFPAGHLVGAFTVYRWISAQVPMFPFTLRHNVAGGGVVFRIQLSGTNKVAIQNPAGTVLGTSAAVVPGGRLNRFDVTYDLTTGDITVDVFNGEATGTPDATVTVSGASLGSNPISFLEAGTSGGAVAADQYIDSLIMDTGATVAPGPYTAAATPPVADAGADQADVEPYTTVTVTGAGTAPSGSIVSSGWSQTAGPASPLVGTGVTRTQQAPGTVAGTTVTDTYSVTDNLGGTDTDTVDIAVLPVTERAAVAGVEVPVKMEAVAS